ncbi:tetratricopeptide (TPR) repeat protein [Azospirillum fermentarium]|uniref:tetratricopeptide repeat protein n=1 Tax=Azospirillum fermentarium TaxID=1233114 RepID=UPI00222700B9|nr:tetratricopeptide repeat protein [Azospirillum fermentarium]MCW2247879.1 tetratricopeptide (TPR) repeat protein [Azospirillum fermentarium]
MALSRHRAGDWAGAERAYRVTLAGAPASADALHYLGVLAHQCGRDDAAVRLMARSLALDGRRADVFANYGLALHALGRVGEAEAAYRAAVARRDDYAEAHNSLGTALQDQGRLDEAEAHYRRALSLRPAYDEARLNLGTVLRDAGRWTEAETELRAVLDRTPDNAAALTALGVVEKETGRVEAAVRTLDSALRHTPGDPDALVTLGLIHDARGDGAGAEALYARALEYAPGFPLARWNLALHRLAQGDGAGWELYESRFDSPRILPPPTTRLPPWRGEPLGGRRLLVWREQGVGDEILFGALLPRLAARLDGPLVVGCDARLVPLLRRSLPGTTVLAGADHDGAADCQVPMGSLAHRLGWRLDTPMPSPWLVPDPARAAGARRWLEGLGPGLTVGICWRSGLTRGERRHAYTTLADWAPLLRLPGVRVVVVQYGDCADEVAEAERRFGVTLHRPVGLDLKNDLDGVAALIAGLDLVVTVATSVGEMAGALGVPVWRLVPGGRDWTMLGTQARPFFPSMRVWAARRGQPVAALLPAVAEALAPGGRRNPPLPAGERDGVKAAFRASARKASREALETSDSALPRNGSRAFRAASGLHPTLSPAGRGPVDPVSEAEAVAALVEEGWALIRAGHLPQAEGVFQRALALCDGDAAVLDGYAAVAEAAGRPDIAAELLGRAVEAEPTADRHARRAAALRAVGGPALADYAAAVALGAGDPVTLGNGAMAALDAGRADLAGEWLARALDHAPDWAGLHANHALLLRLAGRPVAPALARALALDPALAEGWNMRAGLLAGSDPAAALAAAERALALVPDHAGALANRGLALLGLGRAEEAAAVFRATLHRTPHDAAAWANLAHALVAAGRGDAAGLAWWRVIWLAPGGAEGFAGLAGLRQGQNRSEAALRAWDRALTLRPDDGGWRYNRANALHALGRGDEADAAYDTVADLPLARFNRGYAALAAGRLADGWQGLEARFTAGQALPDRRFPIPRWQGEARAGKRLLVWREQGVGDEIMFASVYPDILGPPRRLAAPSVVIEADARLVPLLARSFPAAVVRAETGAPMDADCHIPAGSLPVLHRTRLADFPAVPAFLRPDPARVAAWRDRLPPGLRVGLCWRSGRVSAERAGHYTRLAEWEPLLRLPGLVPVCLQYDGCAGEVAAVAARTGITIHTPDGLDLRNDLDGAAALTAALDLVVSAGTSVAEMAGALGVPVWRLSHPREWSALGTGCRPWYPSMRLFVRGDGEPMGALLPRVAAALKGMTE